MRLAVYVPAAHCQFLQSLAARRPLARGRRLEDQVLDMQYGGSPRALVTRVVNAASLPTHPPFLSLRRRLAFPSLSILRARARTRLVLPPDIEASARPGTVASAVNRAR